MPRSPQSAGGAGDGPFPRRPLLYERHADVRMGTPAMSCRTPIPFPREENQLRTKISLAAGRTERYSESLPSEAPGSKCRRYRRESLLQRATN